MSLINKVARPMLGGIFIVAGLNHVKAPEFGAEMADGFGKKVLEPVGFPVQGSTLMKVHGYVGVVAGAGLATGTFPRLSAAVLAGDVTVVNLTTHRYWEMEGEDRQTHQIQFFKDLAIAGGLLVTATSRSSRATLGYRAEHLSTVAGLKKEIAQLKAENAGQRARAAVAAPAGRASGALSGAATLGRGQAKAAKNVFRAKKSSRSLRDRVSAKVSDSIDSVKQKVAA